MLTERINKALKNNPKKFPQGYLIELNHEEKNELVENFDQLTRVKHPPKTTIIPQEYTEG